MRTLPVFSLVVLSASCSARVPPTDAPLGLRTDSGEALSTVPSVDRFYLRGSEELRGEDIWLVTGEVSSTSQGKLKEGVAPTSVEKARIPLATWAEEGSSELTLAPSVPLEPGQRYSWVGVGYGLIATMDVAQEERPIFVRWGEGPVRSLDLVPYCRVSPPLYVEEAGQGPDRVIWDELSPGAIAGLDVSGIASDLCVRVLVDSVDPGFFVPPPSVGEALLDPAPLAISQEPRAKEEDPELRCTPSPGAENEQVSVVEEASEQSLGCVWSEAALLGMRLSPGDYFVTVKDTELGGDRREDTPLQSGIVLRSLLRSIGEELRFGPVAPDRNMKVEVVRLLPGGTARAESISIRTAPPLPRFVLLEVLADPLGPEPASEWVEVGNVGSAPGSLSGFEIWDESGGSALSDEVLLPGQSGVIVRTDYLPGADVLPHPKAIPIWVLKIGQNGLRNSGETVQLLDASGEVVSTIPGRKMAEGVSLARLGPWLADLPESFAPHGAPGGSPGGPNQFDALGQF